MLYLPYCFHLAYLNWNDKAKTKEGILVIISIKLCYVCLIFLILPYLGAKWTFLSYQVISVIYLPVLYLHIKIKNQNQNHSLLINRGLEEKGVSYSN